MMKMIKKIMTSALVVAMISSFSTVAFALSDEANYYTFKADIVEESVKAGDTVTVNVILSSKDGADIEFLTEEGWDAEGCIVNLGFAYDSNILELTGSSNYPGFSPVSGDTLADGKLIQIFTFASDITMSSGDVFVTHTFKVKETVADGTYADAVKIVPANCSLSDGYLSFNLWADPARPTTEAEALVVTSEEEKDDKVTAGTSAAGATKITYGKDYTGSKALDGKYLVKADLGAVELDKNTTFTVTYDNTTKPFGASMWEDLGIENNGTLAASKFVIAVAFDVDVNPADVAIAIAE